jgi:hypothetical protein
MSFQRLGALCQFAIELFSCFMMGCCVRETRLVPALRRRICNKSRSRLAGKWKNGAADGCHVR